MYQILVQYKKEALKIYNFLFFLQYKKWVKKALKFNNIKLNKKEFHKSEEPIDLISVNEDQIVVSDKFKHNNEGFKYFIGYKEGKLLNHYALFYLKWMGTSNTLKPGTKTCLIWSKRTKCGNKFKQIWNVIKNKLGIKFHIEPVYDKTYIKAKVREFDSKIKANFLGNDMSK